LPRLIEIGSIPELAVLLESFVQSLFSFIFIVLVHLLLVWLERLGPTRPKPTKSCCSLHAVLPDYSHKSSPLITVEADPTAQSTLWCKARLDYEAIPFLTTALHF
jgi:hypothetical protein